MGRDPEVIIEYPLESASSAKPSSRTLPGSKVPGANQRGGVGVTSTAPALKESESIDTASVSVQDALGKFIRRETELQKSEATTVGAGSGRRRSDHQAQAAAEQPEERFARLQLEISELLEIAERNAAQRGADASWGEFGGDPDAAVAELRELEQRLRGYDPTKTAALKASRGVGVAGSSTLEDTLRDGLERLVNGSQIESSSQGSKRVTWEINYAPSIGAIADSSHIAMLETALADIEKKLGHFEATPQYADLQTALRHLQRRVSLLDTQKVDAIRQGILKAASSLKSGETEDGDNKDPHADKQLNELHSVCHRWTPTAAALPAIVSRLQSLQTLHQQGASFATRLTALEHQQEEMVTLIQVTNAAVLELSRGMQENMSAIKENLQNLEAKLKDRGR